MENSMTDRELMSIAKKASMNAYVPYSRFPVGAALECDDGTVFSGCNVENAALGSTICTAASAASRYMPTARAGARPAAHAVSFWRSFRRIWRCSAPRRATGTSAISSASCCRTGLIIDGAGAAARVRRRRG